MFPLSGIVQPEAYTCRKVFHAIPLSRHQKDALAEFITDLHSTTFVTPRFFVNMRFAQLEPAGDLYAGAKHRGNRSPNHILATVRAGPTRTKDMFDEIALKINNRWNEVVDDVELGAHSLGNLTAKEERLAKKLKVVAFRPMIAAIENGVVIPGVS